MLGILKGATPLEAYISLYESLGVSRPFTFNISFEKKKNLIFHFERFRWDTFPGPVISFSVKETLLSPAVIELFCFKQTTCYFYIRKSKEIVSSYSTEMVEINGYQNLAMLFRKKHTMLSINVLNILFDCVQDTEENRYDFNTFLVWLQTRLISAGLEPVLRHSEKMITSYILIYAEICL